VLFKKRKSNPNDSKDGEVVILVQWGGYYASEEAGGFGVFRLLDFNRQGYHAQLFREKFDHSPSLSEIQKLEPFLWHAPIAIGALMNKEAMKLVGHDSLDEHALMGYEEYLRQMGAEESAIKELLARLIEFSNRKPMRVRLAQSADGVTITPME